MLPATTKRSNSIYVSHAVVRLELLNSHEKILSRATGFVVKEGDFPSLYTCWHVVTGVDPHKLPTVPPERRHTLRVYALGMEIVKEGVTRLGGYSSFDIPLYDSMGAPSWIMGPIQEGCSGAMTPPPVWDCVRFDISRFFHLLPNAFEPEDDILNSIDISEDAYIVGYPYGYSASASGPDPIFLRRTRASTWGPTSFDLLDGAGAKGMSGGPIVTRKENEWRLAGIYNGVVFPEAAYFEEETDKKNFNSQLPLGKYTMSMLARSVLGVPPELMGLKTHKG